MPTTTRIRRALSAHLGKVLTPEVAATIEAAMMPAGKPIDPEQFDPLRWGDYTISVERFEEVLPELHPLHVQHWQETEGHRHGLVLDPDYFAMRADDAAGELVQIVVRHNSEIVGHVRLYLKESRHTQTLIGQEDTLYVAPEHRNVGLMPVALLRYAECVLRALGAREVRADSKLVNRADVLMRRLKYRPVATMFHKFLGESDVQ